MTGELFSPQDVQITEVFEGDFDPPLSGMFESKTSF